MSAKLHGIVAEFHAAADLMRAAREARQAGYVAIEAYTPFPVEGLAELVGLRRTGVPLIALMGGLAGGLLALGMQVISAGYWYPLNVGGRPLVSWPSFIPITFELLILGSALSTVFGMLALNGLPRPHHPIFELPHFAERSDSRFYLCIESNDPKFDVRKVREFLRIQTPDGIWEVADV